MKKGFEPEEDEDLSPDEEMEMVTAAQNSNGKVFFEKKKEWDGVWILNYKRKVSTSPN